MPSGSSSACSIRPAGARSRASTLPECTDEVWHGYLPEARAGLLYGYRAHGPYEPQHGHRFNPHKLLLDPYARRIAGDAALVRCAVRLSRRTRRAPTSRSTAATARPACRRRVVTDDGFNWGDDRPPNVPWADTVIYEAHVRGLTMLRHDIRPNERGTFAALADPHVIDHLRRLGVTAVELLPVHAFVQDRHLLAAGPAQLLGLQHASASSRPSRATCRTASPNEMRVAVRRLHAAGIEVILDVVYNHTAEGSELGPTLSFRGLDNASYYRLVPGQSRATTSTTPAPATR